MCSWFFVNTNYVFDIRMDIAAMPARGGVTGSQRLRDELLARFGNGKVQVRIAEDRAWLTIKGPRIGLCQSEFEYKMV